MDERLFELAAKAEQEQREIAARAVAEMNRPQAHPDFDGTHCVNCEDDIPHGRLAMGKVYCTACQTELDIRAKRRI